MLRHQGALFFLGFLVFQTFVPWTTCSWGGCNGNGHLCFNEVKLDRSSNIIPLPHLNPYLLPPLTYFCFCSCSLSFLDFLHDFFLLSCSSLLYFSLSVPLFIFPYFVQFLSFASPYPLVHIFPPFDSLLQSHILSYSPSCSPLSLAYFIAFLPCLPLASILSLSLSLSLSLLHSRSLSLGNFSLPFLFFPDLTPFLSNFISHVTTLSLSPSFAFLPLSFILAFCSLPPAILASTAISSFSCSNPTLMHPLLCRSPKIFTSSSHAFPLSLSKFSYICCHPHSRSLEFSLPFSLLLYLWCSKSLLLLLALPSSLTNTQSHFFPTSNSSSFSFPSALSLSLTHTHKWMSK